MGFMISRHFGLVAFGAAAYGVAFCAFMISGSAGVFLMGAGTTAFTPIRFCSQALVWL